MSSLCWRDKTKTRDYLFEPLHSAPTVGFFTVQYLSHWYQISERCVQFVLLRMPVCATVYPHLCVRKHVFLYLCTAVCAAAPVCLRLVTLEPVVLSSDPDPCHLSTQITHTHSHGHRHTHNCCYPFLELKPNSSCQPCKLASTARFCFLFVGVCITRKTYCLL